MTATINIQTFPVPDIWLTSELPEPRKLMDQDVNIITDESDQELQEG